MQPVATKLLSWYQQNARPLPWRCGDMPVDKAYAVWLSETMLQQTTVKTVIAYFEKFLALWPTVSHMAHAPLDDILAQWAGLGYYARARNLHKCATIIDATYGGQFPPEESLLLQLPGIGPYTAAAISAFAFQNRAVVVDTNIERVISRLFAIETPLPKSKPLIYAHMDAITPDNAGDFAQAMMDFANAVCKPKTPHCNICPLYTECTTPDNIKSSLPKKIPKKQKPHRYAHMYVVRIHNTDNIVTETRPSQGLLGGMQGLPTSSWGDSYPTSHYTAPTQANWYESGQYKHTFTHFHLHSKVFFTEIPHPLNGYNTSNGTNLPTVFKKALQYIVNSV